MDDARPITVAEPTRDNMAVNAEDLDDDILQALAELNGSSDAGDVIENLLPEVAIEEDIQSENLADRPVVQRAAELADEDIDLPMIAAE